MAKTFRVGPILTILVLAVIIYAVYMSSVPHTSGPLLQIGVPEAKARRFGLIIDVRTPKERELLGYYPNSIPIPPQMLEQQVPLDISSKNTWILVYSNGDNRAKLAAETLYKMGYKNVRYITETYLSLMPGSK
jgi:rhodanese-related sulfurtransferase